MYYTWKHNKNKNITKYYEIKRKTDHGHRELSNMLVKKNVLNKINKEGTFTQGFKDCRENKRKVSQNLNNFQNLLIKLTVKASSEKAWLLYEFPFSLNPGDKPSDAQASKDYSSLYPVSTEDQFQASSKKNWWNILEAAK